MSWKCATSSCARSSTQTKHQGPALQLGKALTTLRENRASTVAKYSRSASVRMYVMSLTYARLAALGLNCRFSTLAATGRPCLLPVVWMN